MININVFISTQAYLKRINTNGYKHLSKYSPKATTPNVVFGEWSLTLKAIHATISLN